MKIRLLPFLALLALSCTENKKPVEAPSTAFTNFTFIDIGQEDPLTNTVLVVKNGKVSAIGSADSTQIPKDALIVDLKGKFVIPGLINSHGHVGDVKGIEGGHYSRENIIDNLETYARYGITTVVSLGGDKQEAVPLRNVNDTTSGHARLFIAGEIITGKTPAEALAVVENNHAMGVDIMKIRVDDNLGSSEKMSEDVYKAVIARSHELGYKVASHMYYLEDAKKLMEAHSDMLAHSVRDVPVDEVFTNLISQGTTCYCPTLTRELSTYVYGDTADFFTDPFFTREYDEITIQPLKDPKHQEQIRNSKSAQTYKKQLPVAMANLKTLIYKASVIFGTDSGVPNRFIGYFEHVEMAMMAEAGISPRQILISATAMPALCLNLTGVGELSEGFWADFVVLDANPLDNILNTRTISDVYIGGKKVPVK